MVTAQFEKSDQRKLETGDDVRQQDLIEVSSDGRGEFKLRDQTKLALGPGSRLLLDRFIYDPDISGGAIVLNLAKGAFRFITGVAAKPAYVIHTPTASITVRGTIFDVYVQADGMSWLLLIEGAVEVCSENGKCRVLDEPGKLIRITPDGSIGIPANWGISRGNKRHNSNPRSHSWSPRLRWTLIQSLRASRLCSAPSQSFIQGNPLPKESPAGRESQGTTRKGIKQIKAKSLGTSGRGKLGITGCVGLDTGPVSNMPRGI